MIFKKHTLRRYSNESETVELSLTIDILPKKSFTSMNNKKRTQSKNS